MEKVKLCKDCDYYRFHHGGPNECRRPIESFEYDVGYIWWYEGDSCRSQRGKENENACGKEAKFFKPRRPWWKRLLRLK